MYLLNTLLDEYRLPYMEKQQICEESVSIKNTEKLYEILNQYNRKRLGVTGLFSFGLNYILSLKILYRKEWRYLNMG